MGLENKDNNLRVYKYRTAKVWYVDVMKAMLICTLFKPTFEKNSFSRDVACIIIN